MLQWLLYQMPTVDYIRIGLIAVFFVRVFDPFDQYIFFERISFILFTSPHYSMSQLMKLVLSLENAIIYYRVLTETRDDLMKKIRIQVQGRVQGVGFVTRQKLLAWTGWGSKDPSKMNLMVQ